MNEICMMCDWRMKRLVRECGGIRGSLCVVPELIERGIGYPKDGKIREIDLIGVGRVMDGVGIIAPWMKHGYPSALGISYWIRSDGTEEETDLWSNW